MSIIGFIDLARRIRMRISLGGKSEHMNHPNCLNSGYRESLQQRKQISLKGLCHGILNIDKITIKLKEN